MESGSPIAALKLNSEDLLKTCLSKNSLMLYEEEVKDSLKRKRDMSADECRLKAKKRVSFGSVRILNEKEPDMLVEQPSLRSAEEYNELAMRYERLEREIEELELKSARSLDEHRSSMAAGYDSLLENVSSKLGINPRGPSADDVEVIKAKNQEVFQTLSGFNDKLSHKVTRNSALLDAAAKEVRRLNEEVQASKSTKEAHSKQSKKKLVRLRSQLQWYTELTRTELTRLSDSDFRGRVVKSDRESLVFDLRVEERSGFMHYSKVSSTFSEVEGMIDSTIYNITEREVPMIFRRLLNLVIKP
jgi:hypothetical protein